MNTPNTTPGTLIRSAREIRDWSQEQLAEASGLDAALVRKAEEEGVADRPTLEALSKVIGIPTDRLVASGKSRRQQVAAWVAIGLGFVLLASLAMGYRVGKDAALRDNYRDCVAAGNTDCVDQR